MSVIACLNCGEKNRVKLDVDTAQEIFQRYQVQGIPLLVLIRDGQEVDRLVGAVPAQNLRAWLDRHLTPAAMA